MPLTHFTISIRCKSYLKKYFTTLYGDPIELKQSQAFADTILTKLCNKSTYRIGEKNANICHHAVKNYTGKLIMKIPFNFFYRIDKSPSIELQYNINLYLQKVFEEDFCEVVQRAHTWANITKKIAIEKFADNHAIIIDEEITYEALKQIEHRYRKDPKKRNKLVAKVSLHHSITEKGKN